MRVCIVTTAFPRWLKDDRGIFVFNAAKALKEKGCSVRVIAIHSPGALHREDMNGIDVIRPRYLPDRFEVLQSEGGGLPIIWDKYPLARLALIPFVIVHTLAIAWHGRDCDVIHANWSLSAMGAWLSSWIHRRPFLVTVQGSDIYKAAQIPWIRFMTRVSFRKAQFVIALSDSLAENTRRIGINPDKIIVVPNGVDTNKFTSGSIEVRRSTRIILFVGSLIERKGVRYLLSAMPKVIREFPNIKLVIIGEGGEEVNLKNQLESTGITNQVDFLGKLPPDEIALWMRRASLFILPSLEEGLGVVLLEAIASGTPCVASSVGGIPDIITPEIGRLVSAGQPEQLSDAIIELLSNEELLEQMGSSARRRAMDIFSWDVVADKIYSIYAKALGVSG